MYGTVGIAFDHDVERMGRYLGTLAEAAGPFALRIEGPLDAGGRDGAFTQIIVIKQNWPVALSSSRW